MPSVQIFLFRIIKGMQLSLRRLRTIVYRWPAAALVGTNKLPWEALGNVRQLYLCLDPDVTGEGQKAAYKLACEAVLRGIPVNRMEDGVYGGYSEPADQWEAEGRVTLDGAELELCQKCKAPVYSAAKGGVLVDHCD